MVDSWAPFFDKRGTIFENYNIKPLLGSYDLTRAKSIDYYINPSILVNRDSAIVELDENEYYYFSNNLKPTNSTWGIDRGLEPAMFLNKWEGYKDVTMNQSENWTTIDTNSGGIVTTVPLTKGKSYTFEIPIILIEGNISISIQWDEDHKEYFAPSYLDSDQFFKTKVLHANSDKMTVYIYSDEPTIFKVDLSKAIVREMTNDFNKKVSIKDGGFMNDSTVGKTD